MKFYPLEVTFLCLKRYTSKAISELKTDTQNKKVIFKFDRAISLNTVNNAISAFLNKNNIKINEIEYKPDKKKVEIEVE